MKHLKWDGIVIPMHTPNKNLFYVATKIQNIGYSQNVFAKATTPMSILDVKYEKANIDATINLIKHSSGGKNPFIFDTPSILGNIFLIDHFLNFVVCQLIEFFVD
jgi:hypothetical protein